MSHETPRVFKSPSGQSEVTVNGIGFDEAVDFMQANGWRELPVATEAKAEPATDVWPRTFEAVMDGSVCRVVFNSKSDTPRDVAVRGRQVGARGFNWSWEEVIRDVGSTSPTAWHEVPSCTEITSDELNLLRQSLAESQDREKQERALRAEAEAEVAKLRERVRCLEAKQ
jgi:hypothetical protein